MPEPAETPSHKKASLHLWGYVLLATGFLWLSASRLAFGPMTSATATAFASNAVAKKESFTPQEALDMMLACGQTVAEHPPWMFLPALLMLAGGILLSRAGSK